MEDRVKLGEENTRPDGDGFGRWISTPSANDSPQRLCLLGKRVRIETTNGRRVRATRPGAATRRLGRLGTERGRPRQLAQVGSVMTPKTLTQLLTWHSLCRLFVAFFVQVSAQGACGSGEGQVMTWHSSWQLGEALTPKE